MSVIPRKVCPHKARRDSKSHCDGKFTMRNKLLRVVILVWPDPLGKKWAKSGHFKVISALQATVFAWRGKRQKISLQLWEIGRAWAYKAQGSSRQGIWLVLKMEAYLLLESVNFHDYALTSSLTSGNLPLISVTSVISTSVRSKKASIIWKLRFSVPILRYPSQVVGRTPRDIDTTLAPFYARISPVAHVGFCRNAHVSTILFVHKIVSSIFRILLILYSFSLFLALFGGGGGVTPFCGQWFCGRFLLNVDWLWFQMLVFASCCLTSGRARWPTKDKNPQNLSRLLVTSESFWFLRSF